MRFLIDADLPRRSVELLRNLGYEAQDVRDIGLGSASDTEIAAYARGNDLCLVTGDFGFADIRNYPSEKYAGVVVIAAPPDATAEVFLRMLGGFAGQSRLLKRLPGRLAIIEPGRVRFRPA